jgi:hypothetical protein
MGGDCAFAMAEICFVLVGIGLMVEAEGITVTRN